MELMVLHNVEINLEIGSARDKKQKQQKHPQQNWYFVDEGRGMCNNL